MSFAVLGLRAELLKALTEQGYAKPSPIQCEAIPAILSQCDVMAVAQTGTGKTAGFALPVLQLLSAGAAVQPLCVRALIITPTRELAAQVAKSVENYSRYVNIRCTAAYGGMRIEPQITKLQEGVDVLVATPGRLLDLYNQQAFNFSQLEILVLDEADRMLDLGFVDDIRHIQSLLPNKPQTLMFSATFSKEIKLLAQGMLVNPLLLEVTAANSTVDRVKQLIHPVDKGRKTELLLYLINKNKWSQVLVFSRTKQGADALVLSLEKAGINAASIHADRSQHARTLNLDGFKDGNVKVLVATDIAARGIDINQLPCVINFDLPYVAQDYVHRIGRTGRADKNGLAISLFSEDEAKQLQVIEGVIDRKLEREIIPGFAPRVKPSVKPSAPLADDEDEYGNFEPDVKPQGRGHNQGRGVNSAKHKRKR